MGLEVKTFCPLGAACEEAKDGAIVRCAWYTHVRGTNRNTNEEVDHWACAMHHMPMLLIENSFFQRATSAEVSELRVEVAQGNKVGQQLIASAIHAAQVTPQLVDIQ